MKRGYIKLYRASLKHLHSLSDAEYRYYIASLQLAIWDPKNKQQGELDARTKTMKEYLEWSDGKISEIKKSLLSKGYYSKISKSRLKIANARMLFGSSRKYESIIQKAERNIHLIENNFQSDETLCEKYFDKVEEKSKNNPLDEFKPSFLRNPSKS